MVFSPHVLVNCTGEQHRVGGGMHLCIVARWVFGGIAAVLGAPVSQAVKRRNHCQQEFVI